MSGKVLSLSLRGVVTDMPLVKIAGRSLFEDRDFLRWLEDAGAKATWHKKGSPTTEWSDVFIYYGGQGEGSDSDMPEHCWDAICDVLRSHGLYDEEVFLWIDPVMEAT